MNVVIEEIISEFPVLITEEVVQIEISDVTSYFDLVETLDTNFTGKNGYVPTVNESSGKLVLQLPTGGGGGAVGFIVISTNTTASNDSNYSVVANATFTDPTPVEGKGYIVFVRNGTATIGGVGYTAGRNVYRFFHSGAWSSTVYVDKTYVDSKVTDAIVDGVIDISPSQNAVFDALALKENTITAGTSAQYYRGDKTFQTLDKSAVGLGNVDNTSDANKPVSTATQTALNLKQNSLGFTPEDTANKSTSTTDSASSVKFPVWSAILSYFDVTRIKTILGITTLSGSNTGDQTSIVGITGTKAEFNTANSDGNFVFENDDITLLKARTNKVFYSDNNGFIIDLPLGANGTFLKSNGPSVAPSFETPSGGGGGITAEEAIGYALIFG